MIVGMVAMYQFYWRLRRKVKKLPPGPSRLVNFFIVIKCIIMKRKIDVMTMNHDIVKYYGQNGIWFQKGFGIDLCKISSSKIARQVLNNKHALDRPVFGDPKSEIHIENTIDGTGYISPFSFVFYI